MILYKYVAPARFDVLEHRRIRFTQPADFNDPFEFRLCIQSVSSQERVRRYVEENFEKLLDEELAKYGALTNVVPLPLMRDLLRTQKTRVPELFRLLEPKMIEKVSAFMDSFLNKNVGVLCLSETRDSILMWGHYTESHRGFVVGFDSDHSFFSKRRSEEDEFGFLRQVIYQRQRPNVVISDTSSPAWFQTKSEQWAYEKEWRLVRVLAEAEHQANAAAPFPTYLFELPTDAVLEIIVGMRSTPALIQGIKSLLPSFPRATLLLAMEDPAYYSLIIDRMT